MINHPYEFLQSEELWERAKDVIPLGTQTFSKSPYQFAFGLTPKFIENAKGCRIWDVDGNEFIDYLMACQPVVLGYCDDDVNAAISEQLEKGIIFSLASPLETQLAERLIEIIPSAEAVRYGKNGADVTSAAIRIARAVTGRNHVAYCGYHGWHDWYIANTDLNDGIPDFNQELSHSFAYNDIDSLAAIFEAFPDQIAAIIMEPLQVSEPKNDFLKKVREVADSHGALLIFDEIVTGFRFSLGGAQELVGVIPDITCLAKGMSNGMPLSAVVGKKEYMDTLSRTFFSFTYGGECLSLAAAIACTEKMRREDVIGHLWQQGEILKSGINELAEKKGVSHMVSCDGYPCRTIMAFKDTNRGSSLELKTYFQQEMIKRGFLFTGLHAMSYSHQAQDIESTLNAYDDILTDLKKIDESNRSVADSLEVPVVKPVFRNVADFMAQTIQRG